jgi:hypothetical protein
MNYTIFYTDYWYVVIVAAIMILSGYAAHYHITSHIYNGLKCIIPNKKWLLVILSMLGGILPIKGRVVASAGMFDIMMGRDTNSRLRPKFGILNYIATHHYYMWSPLEKTVLIPMAVLNLTYLQVLGYTWPLLLISLLVLFGYIAWGMRDINDFELHTPIDCEKVKFPNPLKFITWGTLVWVYAAVILGNIAKEYNSVLMAWIDSHHGNFFLVSLTAFVASWIMGSSGKFAGIVASLCAIYGIEYLTYFMAIEFAGYLISPAHKCTVISCKYFNTPVKEYATALLIWAGLIVIYGVVSIL